MPFMKICFVVRSVYSQIATYTTTHLAFEAQRRGHTVAYTTVNSFSYGENGKLYATVAMPGDATCPTRSSFLGSLKGE